MNITDSQRSAIQSALESALRTVVGQRCRFFLAFAPLDERDSICATNLDAQAAIELLEGVMAHLERRRGIAADGRH